MRKVPADQVVIVTVHQIIKTSSLFGAQTSTVARSGPYSVAVADMITLSTSFLWKHDSFVVYYANIAHLWVPTQEIQVKKWMSHGWEKTNNW